MYRCSHGRLKRSYCPDCIEDACGPSASSEEVARRQKEAAAEWAKMITEQEEGVDFTVGLPAVVKELEAEIVVLRRALELVKHDDGCHPSEESHTENCKTIKAAKSNKTAKDLYIRFLRLEDVAKYIRAVRVEKDPVLRSVKLANVYCALDRLDGKG